jgi:PIN domain nuclease of toxin-antitoxin system
MIQLDTNALVWRELAPQNLSLSARSAIEAAEQAGEEISTSAVTLWEIALLTSRGKIQVLVPIQSFFQEIEDNYKVLSLNGATAIEAAKLPRSFPKDPMDRLITASAIVNDLTLITADRAILDSKSCKLLW